ncbi:MAG TPA: S8 family serine peptidase [Gaiellaceae bacterium]|nr:S8 family serine peptidase [Gaiellaceae bacterium]
MNGNVSVPQPSRRVKIVLSVLLALCCWALAVAPERAAAAAFVPVPLLQAAEQSPGETFRVVVVGAKSSPGAASLRSELGLGAVKRQFSLFDGLAVELRGAQLVSLAKHPRVASITADRPVKPASAGQVWPEAIDLAGVPQPNGSLPAIAIVDSGIDDDRADFAGRVVASVNLTTGSTGSGDDNGHGTLVAGLAAGASAAYGGAAPSAPLVSLDVVDANGHAFTSDVIAAADWILANRSQYGIRVANFSLRSADAAYALHDPLALAVRQLWLSGIVVVTAAGNEGPQRMLYAPASDPFVITVGAVDTNGTAGTVDDTNAPWTSYGHTAEGFAKPELGAPGRYLSGPVPAGSTLPTALPERVVAPGYMWMSGTSFAAPIVAGTAARLLALHPEWGPDEVKGALMLTANHLSGAAELSVGVGEIDAAAAAGVSSPPNPNENLYAFVAADANGVPTFDAEAWNAHVATNSSWTSSSWTSSSWTSSSWTSSSWTSSSWTSSSWTSSSWTSSSWTSSSWTSSSWTSSSWTSSSWTSSSWTS